MFTIRRATVSEHPLLVRFQTDMCIETEGRRLQRHLIDNGVKRALSDPTLGATVYVAEEVKEEEEEEEKDKEITTTTTTTTEDNNKTTKNKVVAMMMSTQEFDLLNNGLLAWFQSVFVSPDYRRHGIFRMFYRHLREIVAASPMHIGMRLDVDRTNTRAETTYLSLGMRRENLTTLRWTAEGMDLMPLEEDAAGRRQEQHQQSTTSPLSVDKSSKIATWAKEQLEMIKSSPSSSPSSSSSVPVIKVRPLLAEDVAKPDLLSTLVAMQIQNAVLFYGEEKDKLSAATIAESIRRVAERKHGLRDFMLVAEETSSTVTTTATTSTTGETSMIVASLFITFEHSDWRDSAVANLHYFCVAAADSRIAARSRTTLFVEMYAAVKKMLLQSLVSVKELYDGPPIGGIRLAVVEKLNEDLLAAARELGLTEERYYWMRWMKEWH